MKKPGAAFLVAALALACVPAALAWETNNWEFLEKIERASLRFYEQERLGPYALLKDFCFYDATNAVPGWCNISGIGFELTALCLGHYRGWISYADAYERVLYMLRAFNGEISTNPNVLARSHGFAHQLYYLEGANAGEPLSGVAEPVIDHSQLMAGIIFAGEYFKGTEVGDLARKLYEDTQWNSKEDWEYTWFNYSENILSIIVAADAPQSNKHATARSMWSTIDAKCPSLLTNGLYYWQFPHSWVDFRFRTDTNGIDHTAVARSNVEYQRNKCIELGAADPTRYTLYGSNGWGLSATWGSTNYGELQVAERPSTSGPPHSVEECSDSGSLTPCALAPCVMFAPDHTMAALKDIYWRYHLNTNVTWFPAYGEMDVWNDLYGFMGCFNNSQPWNTAISNFYSYKASCIEHGPNVLMLENYKLGTTWRYFMQNASIETGMYTVGFCAPTNVTHADFAGASNQFGGGLGAWYNDGTPVWTGYVDVGYVNDEVQGYTVRMGADNDDEGAWVDLNGCDQRGKAQLSFWACADSTNVRIEVGLVDRQWNEKKVKLEDYAGGATPTTWTQVKIPVERFCLPGPLSNDVWLGSLDKVTFAFMNTNGGQFNIDYVAFTRDTRPPPAPATRFGVAQSANHARVTWDASALERDTAGLQLWRRWSDTGGFTSAAPRLIPLHQAPYNDMSMTVEPGQEVRFALQAVDNAAPQNESPFTLERRVWGGRLNVDWNNGTNPNVLGGNFDGYWGAATTQAFEFVEQLLPCGITGWVRRSFVSTPWGGHFIYAGNRDLGDYGALSFYIKGLAGGEGIEAGLKDSGFFEIKQNITNYLDGGRVTTNWLRAVLPFADFPGVNLTSLDNISFTHTTSGEVWIAELCFLKDQRWSFTGNTFVEAEHCARQEGSRARNEIAGASAGQVLGADWGRDDGDFADYHFQLGRARTGLTVRVRYACDLGDGRSLAVKWDDVSQGSINCTNTGGWGSSTGDFSWAQLVLPATSTGFHKLTLAAGGADDPVNLDCLELADDPVNIRECEDYDSETGSGGTDYKPAASRGEVLGSSWGAAANSEAVYSNVNVGVQTGAWFHLWYAVDSASYSGRVLGVYVDGTKRAQVVCVGTPGWGDRMYHFDRASARIGALSSGAHTVRIAVSGGGVPVNLDCFYIGSAGPDGLSLDSDRDGLSDRQEQILLTAGGDADTDDDGVSDGDELQYGVYDQVTDPKQADADADTMNDLEEGIAGTDPWDGDSIFLLGQPSNLAPAGIVIKWPSVANRYYTLGRTTNLLGAIAFTNILTDAPATPAENSYTDTIQGLGPFFYRLGVRR